MNAVDIVDALLEAGEEQDFERYSDDIANERMGALKAFCNEVQDLLVVVDDGNAENNRLEPNNGAEESRWMFLWDRLDEIKQKFGL